MANIEIMGWESKQPNASIEPIQEIFKKHERLAFGLTIILIVAVQLFVLARGFVDVSLDEYSRVLLAASWAESPNIFNGNWFWLPGHSYLLGLGLTFYYDLILTPRIFTMLFSLISLGMLYLLTRQLFSRGPALVAVLIVGLHRIHISLSLTPLTDIVYLAFIIGFLYVFFVWLEAERGNQILLAAVLLGVATAIRHEGWFSLAAFNLYLGGRWLRGVWAARSFQPVLLLAISLASLPVSIWMVGSYIFRGDPLYFANAFYRVVLPDATGLVGPMTDIFPGLAYIELLLVNGALISVLAVVGIALSLKQRPQQTLLYLAFSFSALVILTLKGDGKIGVAYKPRYILQYLVLLAPFCAYAIWGAIAARRQSSHHGWRSASRDLLALVAVYNLWLVYLRFSHRHSWVLIGLLALGGIALSFHLLSRKHWGYFTLGLVPLPILIGIIKIGDLSPAGSSLSIGLYFILLALFYAAIIWQAAGDLKPPSVHHWRTAGVGILALILIYNGWGILFHILSEHPQSDSDFKAGLRVRQLFDEGALSDKDTVLLETDPVKRNYKKIQVYSNHPGNFVLDRVPVNVLTTFLRENDTESFFLSNQSSPYPVDRPFVTDNPRVGYDVEANPLTHDSASLAQYLADKHIRLVVIRDPRIATLLSQETEFAKIDQVDDYLFYYAGNKPAGLIAK